MTVRNLDYLLKPKSVALIGASERAGSVGQVLAKNLLDGGFSGAVWPVNPGRDTIQGVPAFRRIEALPATPDLAVIATPPQHVAGVVGELAERGTRAAVVITAGLDADARQRMLAAGRHVTMRIQGPNCLGLMLPPSGLNASFSHIAPPAGDIAFLSQSGALILAVVDWAAGRGIGFSHVVSLGDMADVDFGDLLDYLAADRQSRAILLYIENITHAAKFMSAARRAARVKPVIAVKAGRHETAARAAFSHTGSLAGADHAYEAAFRRAGVVRVQTLHDLFDAAEVLTRVPPLRGDGLTILTNGGGAGILATDRLADLGGTLAELGDETRAALDGVLPATWSHANPVDIIGDAGPERYDRALAAILEDPATDCILAINCPTALASATEIADVVTRRYAAARESGSRAALITNWLGEGACREARRMFTAANIPTFDTPAQAVNAHGVLVAHRKAQLELSRTPPSDMAAIAMEQVAQAEQILAAARGRKATTLSEFDAKQLLGAYGVPVVPTEYARTAAEARLIGERMLKSHNACVVKIAAEEISHKSDVGGVVLNLGTADAVEAAACDILTRTAALRPEIAQMGVVVQPMIVRRHAVEVIAGMSVDDTFGPMIMFGAGGTAVEVLRDTTTALPPLDPLLAREMIARTRVSRLLAGYRDHAPADVDSLADALVRLSYLIARHPDICELDVNPLLVDRDGVIALDARVRLLGNGEEPRRAMAIRPYPIEWEARLDNAALGGLFIRPIRPDDEPRLAAFFDHVTENDKLLRFFTARPNLSHRAMARLTQIDYAREMMFVAINTVGEIVGSVRMVADPDYERAEYGVLVRSDLKGQGLGWQLMEHLVAYARKEGITTLYGCVLRGNAIMLQMCEKLGFAARVSPDDPSVVDVELVLNGRTVPAS